LVKNRLDYIDAKLSLAGIDIESKRDLLIELMGLYDVKEGIGVQIGSEEPLSTY
jgi:hypothetical protein